MKTAIEVRGIGKWYRHVGPDRPHTLKEAALHSFRGMRAERFWALRDVSFDVSAGGTFGVIGANGAGKSTLLRLLAGVERPDEGTLGVRGRVGALLELGSSFHMDLTGRENATLSAVVAGLTRRQAKERMDEIVAFAQLERFIDSPVRTYSSGMVMRLAFSVATHIDADVLIVDEALSVGDISFQQRCIERLLEFRRAGVTTVIVSHDPNRIRDLCDEVIWIKQGEVAARGRPVDVTARYLDAQAADARRLTPRDARVAFTSGGIPLEVHRNRFGSLEATIEAVRIRDAWGESGSTIASGAPLGIEIDVVIPETSGPAMVGVALRRSDEAICFDIATPVEAHPDGGRVVLDIERLDVAGGTYALDVGLYSADWTRTFDYHYAAYPLTVVGAPPGTGLMSPPVSWKVGTRTVTR